MMDSIVLCPKCGARVILEEMVKHQCAKPYRLEGNVLYLRGKNGMWKRHILPERVLRRLEAEGYHPEADTPFGHPEDWTVYRHVHKST